MAFKGNRFLAVSRVILLTVCIFFACWLFLSTDYIVIPTLVSLLAVFIMFRILRLIERAENNFFNFLNAVKYFDLIYLENIGNKRTHKKYRQLYEEVIEIFRKLKSEKEINFENLQNIIQNIQSGIICYDHTGKIELINKSALEMLQKPHITNVSVLQNFDPEFYQVMSEVRSGENRLVRKIIRNKIHSLNLQAKEFKIRGIYHKLVIIQNLKNELDNHEIESYRKLISVLTHEIMNSMTPVISLAEIVETGLTNEKLEEIKQGKMTEEELEEIRISARIISNRSKNLLKFVQTYRSLTKIPQPQPDLISVKETIEKIEKLFRPQLLEEGITWEAEIEKNMTTLAADPALLDQVLINLVKNALESLKNYSGTKTIRVYLYADNDHQYIEISDTGPGIEPEAMENIFVPFFTTKVQGSGIGLSLCKQIMRLHGGNIYVRSIPGQGAAFTLEF